MNRRNFVQSACFTVAGLGLAGAGLSNRTFLSSALKRPICAFTKCLQFLSFEEIGEVLSSMGFDGADITLRPGGQIEPSAVKTALPLALKALSKNNVSIPMVVSSITNADDPLTRTVLQTMADSGIRYYRMGWLNYQPEKSIAQNLDEYRKSFEKLADLNERIGIHGDYQNHSGISVGSPVWDLFDLFRNVNPKFLGVQYDIRHAVLEGFNSWKLGMQRIGPWINTIGIKDFVVEKDSAGKWIIRNVPLGEGMVNFDEFFKEYAVLKVEAPISIHFEYDMGGAELGKKEITMDRAQIYEMMKTDLNWLKTKLKQHHIDQ